MIANKMSNFRRLSKTKAGSLPLRARRKSIFYKIRKKEKKTPLQESEK